jgi:hypothetical protein
VARVRGVVRVRPDEAELLAVQLETPARLVVREGDVAVDGQRLVREDCPGREPPFLALKRPARPYNSATAV